MSRQTPFADIVRHLTPFFVSRQVVCGAGRVGLGQDGNRHGFQLSQRADYFEVEVGLETTLKRPIINTRDEPHADPERYRRLHVIIGDANLSEVSTYLKLGTTSLILSMIEEGFLAVDLSVERPVTSLHEVSHDVVVAATCSRSRTAAGSRQSSCRWSTPSRRASSSRTDTAPMSTPPPPTCWNGGSRCSPAWRPTRCRYRPSSTGWPSSACWSPIATVTASNGRIPKLHLVDLQYSDVRPARGLYHRLVSLGRMQRLIDDDEVARAVHEPPEDTRAYFRGRCLAKYAAARGRRVLGLGDLRPAGPGRSAAGAHSGAASGHESPRRRPAGPLPNRRGAGTGPFCRVIHLRRPSVETAHSALPTGTVPDRRASLR